MSPDSTRYDQPLTEVCSISPHLPGLAGDGLVDVEEVGAFGPVRVVPLEALKCVTFAALDLLGDQIGAASYTLQAPLSGRMAHSSLNHPVDGEGVHLMTQIKSNHCFGQQMNKYLSSRLIRLPSFSADLLICVPQLRHTYGLPARYSRKTPANDRLQNSCLE